MGRELGVVRKGYRVSVTFWTNVDSACGLPRRQALCSAALMAEEVLVSPALIRLRFLVPP